MSKESMNIVKNSSEQLRIKKKQFSALQSKETEVNEKAAKLSKLLEQAQTDYETCMRSNLIGNSSDQKLTESKAKVKELTETLQDVKQTLQLIAETISNLNPEISSLNDEIAVHRSIMCAKLAAEAQEEMISNQKVNERLAAGYAAFMSSGHFDRSWLQHLLLCFPTPSEHDIQLAADKFKASNEFMRD